MSSLRFSLIATLTLAVLGVPGMVRAQDTLPAADSTTRKGGTIVPLPALFYQPETGTGFGALVTYYFRPGARTDSTVPPSELGGSAIYTTRNQILTSLNTRLYLSGGALRLAGSVAFNKFPTKFWGIGNETPDSAEEDYTPLTFARSGAAGSRVRGCRWRTAPCTRSRTPGGS
jgi:hypothetical protein